MSNFMEDKIAAGKVKIFGSKVLLRGVSFIEELKRTGGTQLTMLDMHSTTDANALYYEVVAKGPKVEEVEIGDKVQHVDAAADKLNSNKYCIVDEKFIRLKFEE